MATFVQIEPDAFNNIFGVVSKVQSQQDTFDGVSSGRIGLYHHVRRPVRGIQVKDETYATIQVRGLGNTTIPLFDAAAAGDNGTGIRNSNFLIQNVTEQRAEKSQIILTFGEPYIFFFGEQPRILNITGVLLNTVDFNWRAEWWQNYDLYLRGTQCVRQKTRVYLSWDDIVVEGYVMQSGAVEDASNRNMVQFNFQMFLTNYHNISSVGDANVMIPGGELNLDPTNLDLPGNAPTSSTQLVRNQNQISTQLSQGQGSNSLFDSLRAGNLGQAATTLISLPGQIVDLLSLAGQFISGRNVRVPIGFEGAAAFDQTAQIALASIPGAAEIVNGGTTDNRVISTTIGNTTFTATLGASYIPPIFGPLSMNQDEFVARTSQDDTGAAKFNNLFSDQLAQDKQAEDKVREVFDSLGVDVDPPSDVTNFFKRSMFGIVSLAVGLNLANSPGLTSALGVL